MALVVGSMSRGRRVNVSGDSMVGESVFVNRR